MEEEEEEEKKHCLISLMILPNGYMGLYRRIIQAIIEIYLLQITIRNKKNKIRQLNQIKENKIISEVSFLWAKSMMNSNFI